MNFKLVTFFVNFLSNHFCYGINFWTVCHLRIERLLREIFLNYFHYLYLPFQGSKCWWFLWTDFNGHDIQIKFIQLFDFVHLNIHLRINEKFNSIVSVGMLKRISNQQSIHNCRWCQPTVNWRQHNSIHEPSQCHRVAFQRQWLTTVRV